MDPPRAPVSSTSMVTSCVLPSAFDRVPLKVVVRPDTADSDVKRTASARSVFFSTYRITWFGSTIWAPPLVASTHRTLDPVRLPAPPPEALMGDPCGSPRQSMQAPGCGLWRTHLPRSLIESAHIVAPENKGLAGLSFLGGFLSRRDRIYPLSLLVPFAIYNLALKAYDVTSRPEKLGLARAFKLMRSDVFFNLGYALLWTGLFGVVRRGPLRRVVVFLFHVTTMLGAIVRGSAHEYYKETGTALDYDIVALWLPRPKDVKQMITLSPRARVLLAVVLFYSTLGPWLVLRALGRLRGWPTGSPDGMPREASFFVGPLGLILQALGFGSLSLLTGPGTPGAGKSFARDPFVNLVVT